MPFRSASALAGIHLRQGPRDLSVGEEQNSERPLESQQERRQETLRRLPHLSEGSCLGEQHATMPGLRGRAEVLCDLNISVVSRSQNRTELTFIHAASQILHSFKLIQCWFPPLQLIDLVTKALPNVRIPGEDKEQIR